MRRLAAIGLALALTTSAHAEGPHSDGHHPDGHHHPAPTLPSSHPAPTGLEADEAVIRVNGLVCSFCAHGIERKLRKVPGVDTERFGGDGVLVELESHRITVALEPDAPLLVERVFEEIRNAGYDPVRLHLRVRGTPVQQEGGWQLTTERVATLSLDTGGVTLVEGEAVELVVGIEAAALEQDPIAARVHERL